MHSNFSVVLITHERDKRNFYLRRSLNSILNQTIKPSEIIIVNSGHNKIDLKEFRNLNKYKYKIIHCKLSSNIPSKRNIGAKNSNYGFLAFLDDDDYWSKEYLKNAYHKINNNNFINVILSDVYISENKQLKIFRSPTSNNIEDYFVNNPGAMGSNIIIKKKIFESINGYDEKLIVSEDKALIIDLIMNKIKISFQNNIVVYELNNPSSISKNYKSLIIGFSEFYLKYKKIMPFQIRVSFLRKIYYYKQKNNKRYILIYLIFNFLEIFIK
jgi:glycosyltransferase involved in cell wall biosynthesis